VEVEEDIAIYCCVGAASASAAAHYLFRQTNEMN
jgi:hypothetical protein